MANGYLNQMCLSYCVACHLHSIHWTTIQEDARTIWPVRSQSNAVIIPSIYFSNCRRSRTSTCPSENATWDSGSLQTWVRRLITGKEKKRNLSRAWMLFSEFCKKLKRKGHHYYQYYQCHYPYFRRQTHG
jgi:hypothetical protein